MNKELRPQLTELAKGLRKRTWVTAKLTTKAGLSALAGTILPGRSDGLSDSEEVDDEKALESALALVEQLDDLKGLMMKVGQMASYLDPTLPPRARKVLSTLQANSKPMTFE